MNDTATPQKPTPGAMRAAKALYPNGLATYCYDSQKEIEAAWERDWEAVARKIDAAAEIPELVSALKATTGAVVIAVQNIYPGYPEEQMMVRKDGLTVSTVREILKKHEN